MKKICLMLLIGALIIPNITKAQSDTTAAQKDSLKILNDKNAELYLRLAQISLDDKDYKSVIAYSDSALNRNKSFLAYRLKGVGQFNLGMYKETILTMSLGLEEKQSDFDLHYYRGLSYHIIDSLNYAEQISSDMKWARTINPLDTMAYYYEGLANFNLSFLPNFNRDEKLKDCISNLSQFVRLKKNLTAHYIKGVANFLLAGSGENTDPNLFYQETIKDMTICLELQPKDVDALHYRGICYFIIGDYENSIKDAEILKRVGEEKKSKKGSTKK